jgi:hypothetical protein
VADKIDTNILHKAVLYELSLSCLGTERKVDGDKVKIQAKDKDGVDSTPDKKMLRLTKSLLTCPELDAIKKLDGKIHSYLGKRALPSVRRKGVYFVPLGEVGKVDARMEEFRIERDVLVEVFCAVYESAKEEAKKSLGDLFAEKDYLPVAEVHDAFAFTTSFQSAGVSEPLKDAYPELFAREQQKAQKQWAEAAVEIQQVMREGLKGLVDHMVERLKGNGDGKPKVFRDSLVTNFTEYLEMFEPRNVVDDKQLAELVAKCKGVLGGVKADDLRDTPQMRKAVTASLEQVKSVLDQMVVDKPGRKTMAVD